MGKATDTVIFDLDGTLIDTLEDLKDSVNHVIRAHGFPERSLTEIRTFVGNGIRKLIERSVPAGTEPEETERCVAEMLAYYPSHSMIKTAPYEGVTDVLRTLKERGFVCAVVTNKAQNAAEKLIAEMFGDAIDYVSGDHGAPLKPDPAPVYAAMKALGKAPENCVYAGDSEVDVRTAKNASIPCVGVLWGFRDREVLIEEKAEYLAETPSELLNILLHMQNG